MRRRRDLPPVDEAPETPRASLALVHIRCWGMTSDRPLPEPERLAIDRLTGEDHRLRVAGWSPSARLAAVLELADELGIGDRIRPMVQRVTGPGAGVVVDRRGTRARG